MATLEKWTETKDYGIGLALLAKLSRNRVMLQSLSRKHNPEKLEYELNKLIGKQQIAEETVVPEKIKNRVKATPVHSHSDQEIDIMNSQAGETIDPDTLSPAMKALWLENTDMYKEIRSLHEKLKLLEKGTDEVRQPLIGRIIAMDEKIRANWEQIDSYDPELEEEELPGLYINHKRINANRKFISINLKKMATASDERANLIRTKIQERYDELKNANEAVQPETLVELKKAGIQC